MAMETHNRIVYEGEPVRQEERREERREERQEERHEELRQEDKPYEKVAGGGSALAGTLGLAAIVLSILGLLNFAQMFMVCISAIVVGAALLMEGGSTLFSRERFAGDFSGAFIGGIAGIVLGILSLLGIAANVLLPVAVLSLGTSLFLSSWTGFGGGKLLIGLGSIVLGILALLGYAPMTLCLVAFLSLGCAMLFSGSYGAARRVAHV